MRTRKAHPGFGPVGAAVFLMALAGCRATPQFTTTTLTTAPSTVVDVHGTVSLAGRPAQCQDPAFPPPPSDWWQGVTPQVRQTGGVVGYQVWVTDKPQPACPRDFRTDVYRAFFTLNLSSYAGRSGEIAKATAKLTARALPGVRVATTAAELNRPNALLCDGSAGAAFQLVQVAGALPIPAPPSGMTVDFISSGQFDPARPPIPNSYPSGPVVFNFPTKDITRPSPQGQPTFEADVTQLVVQALAANVTTLKFMLTGTNEPPARKDAPDVPQMDCKAIYSLSVDVQTP